MLFCLNASFLALCSRNGPVLEGAHVPASHQAVLNVWREQAFLRSLLRLHLLLHHFEFLCVVVGPHLPIRLQTLRQATRVVEGTVVVRQCADGETFARALPASHIVVQDALIARQVTRVVIGIQQVVARVLLSPETATGQRLA